MTLFAIVPNMKSKKLSLAVASLFIATAQSAWAFVSIGDSNVRYITNNTDEGVAYGVETNHKEQTVNLEFAPDFKGWVSLGERKSDNASDKAQHYTLTADKVTVDVASATKGKNIKLRTNTKRIEASDETFTRPEKSVFDLNFNKAHLIGDIVNQYETVRSKSEGDVITWRYVSASGNDTRISLDGSTWDGKLSSVQSYEKFDPKYDLTAENRDTHNTVSLKNASTWTGSITNEGKGVNDVNLDNTSSWIVNGYSTVNNLKSDGTVTIDNAILDFQKGVSSVATLKMSDHPDASLQISDGAHVTLKKVDGQSHIHFRSLKDNSLQLDEATKPVSLVVDGDVTESLGFDQTVEKLNSNFTAGQNVQGDFLIEDSLIGDGGKGTINGDKLTVTNRTKNTNLVTTAELTSIQMIQWRAEADDMNQRMGELRDSVDDDGLWVRTYGGKSEASAVDNEFIGVQFGYDRNISSDASKQFVGAALSYTAGDASFSTGSGDNYTLALTGYSTWILDSGSYVDLSLKYGKLNTDFDINSAAGRLSGDYSTYGLAMGVEAGHRVPLGSMIYVEPQVAFTASHIFDEDFNAKNGVTVEQKGIDSYVARVGFVAGLKCPDNMGNVWVKASYLYDFDGETETVAAQNQLTNAYSQDFGGGWYELGVGASVNLAKNLHGYADFEYSEGAEIKTPYKWNIGIRYTY